MLSEIFALILSILGIVFVLLFVLFKLLSWKEAEIVITLPLYSKDDKIFEHIDNLRMFSELCGIHKKCRIVVINYGAPEWFCNKIRFNYEGYDFLLIVDGDTAGEEIGEKIFKENLNI